MLWLAYEVQTIWHRTTQWPYKPDQFALWLQNPDPTWQIKTDTEPRESSLPRGATFKKYIYKIYVWNLYTQNKDKFDTDKKIMTKWIIYTLSYVR